MDQIEFTLRPFRKGDEPSLAVNINSRKIERYTLRIPYPYKPEYARQWVKHNIANDRKKEKTEHNFAIDVDGQVIGSVGLCGIEGHRAEIGYWLATEYWGFGIGTAAVKMVTKYAFKELALRRVYAYVVPANKASSRVLKNCGYKYEGLLRHHDMKKGRLQDSLLFAKTR
jgi:RimJ/RimL family protein N-acetyltransferase